MASSSMEGVVISIVVVAVPVITSRELCVTMATGMMEVSSEAAPGTRDADTESPVKAVDSANQKCYQITFLGPDKKPKHGIFSNHKILPMPSMGRVGEVLIT